MNNKTVKILYVGFSQIGDNSATGSTLYNLYNKNNKIQVLQYCLDYTNENHAELTEVYYISKFKSIFFFIIKSFYRFVMKLMGETNDGSRSCSSHNENSLKTLLKGFLDFLPKKISKRDEKKIMEFSPDIILTIGENISTLREALRISDKYNLPIVFHIMDDIEEFIYKSHITKLFRKKYLSLLNKSYNKTKINIAISEKMADEYTRRKRKKFIFAMNCVDELHCYPDTNNLKFKMIFSGGLHGGRAEIISRINWIIQNDEYLKAKTKFSVFTSKSNIEMYKGMFSTTDILNEYVSFEKYYENLSSADVLLHVESFEKSEIEYFRYSLSTKIPEYLSVGRPVLCYGPRETGTVSYIEENMIGIVAENDDEFKKAIMLLINNVDVRNCYAQNGLKLCQTEHMTDVVSGKIYDAFIQVIENSL